MSEMSTEENEELVARVYTQALESREQGRQIDEPDLMVYHVEMLSQEVNSGASFEQYFRWASVAEISEIVDRLQSLALSEVAQIARRAIDVAFPNGLPASEEDKDDLTEWTEEQELRLGALAEEFEAYNGRIINVLGAFYRDSKRST